MAQHSQDSWHTGYVGSTESQPSTPPLSHLPEEMQQARRGLSPGSQCLLPLTATGGQMESNRKAQVPLTTSRWLPATPDVGSVCGSAARPAAALSSVHGGERLQMHVGFPVWPHSQLINTDKTLTPIYGLQRSPAAQNWCSASQGTPCHPRTPAPPRCSLAGSRRGTALIALRPPIPVHVAPTSPSPGQLQSWLTS